MKAMKSFPYLSQENRLVSPCLAKGARTYVNFDWTCMPRPDLVLNFGAENFVPCRFRQRQYNFAGPRDISGPPTVQDVRIRTTPRFYFNVRKTF